MTDPLRRLTPVVRVAPAKLNLTLAVLGRRADGFHDLHSVMAPLALADRISLAPTSDRSDRLHVAGEAVDEGPSNLVLRAVGALRAALGATIEPPLRGEPPRPYLAALAIRLEKRVPVAAGLGGGSSDAAAALLGATEAWGVDVPGDALHAVAAALGSDVPFSLAGGFAVVTGRGEVVASRRAPAGGPLGILLVTPAIAVATSEVYAAFAAGIRPGTGAARLASEHLAAELSSGLTTRALYDRAGVLASANDLSPATAAVAPAIAPLRRALVRLLGRPVGQSGSGPTAWVLYPSPEAAADAAARVERAISEGSLPPAGDARPRVVATQFAGPDRPASPPEGTQEDVER